MFTNSALSQNWVECIVHTPMAQAGYRSRAHCAVSWCALGRIVAPSPVVSRLCPAMLLLARARCCCVAATYRSPWHAVSGRQACPSCHDTIVCIVTHFASQAPRARCRTPLRAGRPCRRAPRRCVTSPGRLVAVCPAALCHDTICCIMT